LAYIERALNSAAAGRSLSRAVARRIFTAEDELHLELGDLTHPTPVTVNTADALQRERARLVELDRMLPHHNGPGPKATELIRQLQRRDGRKTLVFTSAVATAHYLARIVRWQRVAVVGAGKAWIASGRLNVEDALALFAPKARGARVPGPATHVATLIATDLASEGLDLQDADAVVHYDLPWTPLRLEQRLGRIARLGSEHKTAEVSWFAPHRSIEQRLQMESRIARKVTRQLQLGVTTTSGVGKAQIINQLLWERERLGQDAPVSNQPPGHAVVRGPLAAAFAVRWDFNGIGVPELMVLHERPLHQELEYSRVRAVLERLLKGAEVTTDPPHDLVAGFLTVVRTRLAACHHGPVDAVSRRLARTVVQRAFRSAPLRDGRAISVLNAVLDCIGAGLAAGPQRSLEQELSQRASLDSLLQWTREEGEAQADTTAFPVVVAAVFGDGSEKGHQTV
jgi:hypothetical protein